MQNSCKYTDYHRNNRINFGLLTFDDIDIAVIEEDKNTAIPNGMNLY